MRLAVAAVLVGAFGFALPASSHADNPQITATCNGAPCINGWYTRDVTLVFSTPAGTGANGCDTQLINQDTSGMKFTCTIMATGTQQCCILSVTIKRDATPPTVNTVSLARGPDSNGWYNHALGYSASGTDALSGIASCTSATYSGPDSGSATVNATCTDVAGNVSAPKAATFEYDATPPSVTPSP